MSLLDHDEGDTRFITFLQLHTSLPHRAQLMLQHLQTDKQTNISTEYIASLLSLNTELDRQTDRPIDRHTCWNCPSLTPSR